LTVAEIAEVLKLNPQTVRNWIDRGELPAFHVGRRVRVRREDFDELVARGSTGRAAAPAPSIWDGEIPAPVIP
jgi:excisionase family DNA binding protein